jgi:D-3-phosphoglycerate dehydrogenase
MLNYLEKGTSTGSHTIPAIALPPHEGAHRILHIHANVPGVLSDINATLSKNKVNIVGQYLKTNDQIGYVVLDIDKGISKNAMELLKKVKHTIKVRLLY